MASSITNFIYSLALTFAVSFTKFHISEASGFTIDLIHRDSLQSPSLHSVVPTPSQRVTKALQRSFRRVTRVLARNYDSRKTLSANVYPDKGEYLMKISLGTPPVETFVVADTGSDLTWIQCKPCAHCFHQKAPLFDPSRSSSYEQISCTSDACTSFQRSTSCDGSENGCSYMMAYEDKSISRGDLAKETVTLGSANASIPNITIGCGHSDQGTFGAEMSGIAGLGGGKVSLISQMEPLTQGRFSYCLVPYLGEKSKPSKMNFGDNAAVSGNNVVSTPILSGNPDTFYFLTLEGITVGNQRLEFYDSLDLSTNPYYSDAVKSQGNIIIDSGTTLTFLPAELHDRVIKAVKSYVKAREIDDPEKMLRLCYFSRARGVQVPDITIHFKGADVKLRSFNAFVKTSDRSLCLAFAPATNTAIFGNLAQMDFLIGYDLRKKTLSFKPTDCSKE